MSVIIDRVPAIFRGLALQRIGGAEIRPSQQLAVRGCGGTDIDVALDVYDVSEQRIAVGRVLQGDIHAVDVSDFSVYLNFVPFRVDIGGKDLHGCSFAEFGDPAAVGRRTRTERNAIGIDDARIIGGGMRCRYGNQHDGHQDQCQERKSFLHTTTLYLRVRILHIA